jgi:hypothetical protein
MSVMPAEPDDDEARTLTAQRAATALVVAALARIDLPPVERALIVVVSRSQAANPLSRREMQRVMEVAWRHRRQLPAHLAPRLPPSDPIVQAMEAAHG